VVGDLFDGITAGARRLLNFTTYYRMKARAGVVGARGLAPALATIHQSAPNVRLHLIGHSFGARVVTSAAQALTGDLKLGSLSLLQAAFSHNGFAQRFNGQDDGFFRGVVSDRKVDGPLIITHTRNDKAVGIAYPLASRVAGQNAAGIGDREDPYGGLGRNGAMFTPEARDEELKDVDHRYRLAAGMLYNLKADRFISDHGDITGAQVVHAVLSAVTSD
jgi:esterase/lipase superfamily enzyme